MLRLILDKLSRMISVLLLASLLAFAVHAAGTRHDQDAGVTNPALLLPERYAKFMIDVMRGDLGAGARLGGPVGPALLQRLPATVELAVTALAVSLLLGTATGLLAALRRRWWPCRAMMTLAALSGSIPTVLSGAVLLFVFAVHRPWLPVGGRGAAIDIGGWTSGLLMPSGRTSLILPVVTVALFQAAPVARLVSQGFSQTLDSGFIRFAHARGLPRLRVLRHVLANGLVPLVDEAGLLAGTLLTIGLVTECVFALPGIGPLLVDAIAVGDANVLAACVLLVAVVFSVIDLAAAVLRFALDPRTRPVRKLPGALA